MKFNNCCGTNEDVKKICKVLGVYANGVMEQLDEITEETLTRNINANKEIEIGLGTVADYGVVYAAKPEGDGYDELVAICAGDEGPHWDIPLILIQRMLVRELENSGCKVISRNSLN